MQVENFNATLLDLRVAFTFTTQNFKTKSQKVYKNLDEH